LNGPALFGPSFQGNEFYVSVFTVDGWLYSLEYKDNLSDLSWTPVTDMDGDGAVRVLIDPFATGTQRFYRVRVE